MSSAIEAHQSKDSRRAATCGSPHVQIKHSSTCTRAAKFLILVTITQPDRAANEVTVPEHVAVLAAAV